ncbi:hypothetical protein EV13_0453 [Prochlorococcus sp. MIT 0702]|nr:hypothetical protein EV12_1656 [Prochlorococcus sp. MIT 0701]KGG30122.1 hypothetical protein EV13_0453 [Prochlorococcus sp. MIT 0702]KGG33222.1 hypothetical protein EV14_1693 [Prochlorococcus sp. MIT 0703]
MKRESRAGHGSSPLHLHHGARLVSFSSVCGASCVAQR